MISGTPTEAGVFTGNTFLIGSTDYALEITIGGTFDLYFSGNKITNTTQTVVVGQPIQLTIQPTPTSDQLASWNIPGNTVGGFVWSNTCPTNPLVTPDTLPQCTGNVIPVTFGQSPTIPTFYWTTPSPDGQPYQVGYGTLASAQFVVVGPTSATIATEVPANSVEITRDRASDETYLSCYGYCETFQAQAVIPSTTTGTFEWIQVLLYDNIFFQRYITRSSTYCSVTNALDATIPYPYKIFDLATADAAKDNQTVDSPRVTLKKPLLGGILMSGALLKSVTREFSARMYLMWTANSVLGVPVSNAIPVPLGFVNWGFTATANKEEGKWTAIPIPIVSAINNLPSYPSWSSVLPIGGSNKFRTCS
jgi:hypothetical protein